MAYIYRLLVLLVAVAFLGFGQELTGASNPEYSIINTPHIASTSLLGVFIVNGVTGEKQSFGSGTYIRSGNTYYILTAAHVLAPLMLTNLYACYNEAQGAGICTTIVRNLDDLLIDPERDIAIAPLEGPVPARTALGIEPDYNWSIGETVWVSGYPNGTRSINRGNISGTLGTGRIFIDADVWWGSSGGGVWNDRGELIGVVSALQLVPMSCQNCPLGVVEGNKIIALIPRHLLDQL